MPSSVRVHFARRYQRCIGQLWQYVWNDLWRLYWWQCSILSTKCIEINFHFKIVKVSELATVQQSQLDYSCLWTVLQHSENPLYQKSESKSTNAEKIEPSSKRWRQQRRPVRYCAISRACNSALVDSSPSDATISLFRYCDYYSFLKRNQYIPANKSQHIEPNQLHQVDAYWIKKNLTCWTKNWNSNPYSFWNQTTRWIDDPLRWIKYNQSKIIRQCCFRYFSTISDIVIFDEFRTISNFTQSYKISEPNIRFNLHTKTNKYSRKPSAS